MKKNYFNYESIVCRRFKSETTIFSNNNFDFNSFNFRKKKLEINLRIDMYIFINEELNNY